jgi:hypothetical protein
METEDSERTVHLQRYVRNCEQVAMQGSKLSATPKKTCMQENMDSDCEISDAPRSAVAPHQAMYFQIFVILRD